MNTSSPYPTNTKPTKVSRHVCINGPLLCQQNLEGMNACGTKGRFRATALPDFPEGNLRIMSFSHKSPF